MMGTLQKHYRMTPNHDRWDENYAGPVHAAARPNMTLCGRVTDTSEQRDTSPTGWVYNHTEKSKQYVTCNRCKQRLTSSSYP